MSFTIISMRGCGTHRGADSQLRQKAIAYLKKSTLWQTAYIDDPNHHRYANGERWTQQEAMDAYANGDYSRWEMDSNGDYVPKCPGGPYRSIHDRACRDALYRHQLQAQGYETENDWRYLDKVAQSPAQISPEDAQTRANIYRTAALEKAIINTADDQCVVHRPRRPADLHGPVLQQTLQIEYNRVQYRREQGHTYGMRANLEQQVYQQTVSYTHLTLPTKRIV